jgi:hypothetical protein
MTLIHRRPTHLTVASISKGIFAQPILEYNFFLSGKSNSRSIRTPWGECKVRLSIQLPDFIAGQGENKAGHAGYIEYWMKGGEANTFDYPPKITRRGIRGFGYFAELASSIDIQGRGVLEMMTPLDSSASRRGQLGRVGLPSGVLVPIEDWVEKLSTGIILVQNELAGKR